MNCNRQYKRIVMSTENKKECILVVDDSPDTLEVIQRNLASEGFCVYTASDVPEAIRILDTTSIDLVITDIKMPGISGHSLIRHVGENFHDVEVIAITGYPSIEGAVTAVKTGAEEYIAKPFTDRELCSIVRKTLDKLSLRKAMRTRLQSDPSAPYGLIGESKAIRKIYEIIEKASSTSATVLITGESGTGKELVARAIHYTSARASAPFVPVNCGGIPESLLESELFGYMKGAFTGAFESRAGFFQISDGGTIFLDEISETSPAMQVKLLRVLQDKEIYMIASRRPQKIDVRVIAATNKNLNDLVEKGAFRKDLYYRLHVIPIDVPPLREREEDVLILVQHFTARFARELNKPGIRFSDKTLAVLKNYAWPGNVRELENLVQRMVIMSEGDTIDVADLPTLMRFSAKNGTGLNRTLAELEEEYIRNVMSSVNGNKTRAAQILGIDRKTLREKLKTSE